MKKERTYTQRDVDNIRGTMRKQLERMKMQFDIKQQESLQFVKDQNKEIVKKTTEKVILLL